MTTNGTRLDGGEDILAKHALMIEQAMSAAVGQQRGTLPTVLYSGTQPALWKAAGEQFDMRTRGTAL